MDKKIIHNLVSDGVMHLSGFFQGSELDAIKQETEDFIIKNDVYNVKADPSANFNSLRSLNKLIINRRIAKRDGDEGMIDVWNYNLALTPQSNKFLNIINNKVITALKQSFGADYTLKTSNLYINNSVSNTRGIHADSHFFPSRVKSFLFLTDVPNKDYGPFSYIRGSHLKEGLKYHRKYDVYEPMTEEDLENYEIFEGVKSGDMVIAAVSGAHRGIPQKKGCERRVIVSSFDPVKL
jgi:hypothetical protein